MRILHMCLTGPYSDKYNYQENLLTRINKEDGHDVKIIASTETYIDNINVAYLEPSEYINKDGINVVRLPYLKYIPHAIAVKVRAYENVYTQIEAFKPDVILFHGGQTWELLTVAKYKKHNTRVKLYVDFHSSSYNSAKSWLSKYILHKLFYKACIHRALPYIDGFLSIGYEITEFITNMYDIPTNLLEDYPLGGLIPDIKEYRAIREHIRCSLGLNEQDIMLVHSGKMDSKKRTEELLDAFYMVKDRRLRLVIIGSIADAIKKTIEAKIARDDRVLFLGWKDSSELMHYLMACDLYCQPGSVSATMQNALCCGAPVMVAPHADYKYILENAPFYVDSVEEMVEVFQNTLLDSSILEQKKIACVNIAKTKLDYIAIAARLYQ